MKKDLQTALYVIVTITLAIVSAILAIKGVRGWGWFLFLSFISLAAW